MQNVLGQNVSAWTVFQGKVLHSWLHGHLTMHSVYLPLMWKLKDFLRFNTIHKIAILVLLKNLNPIHAAAAMNFLKLVEGFMDMIFYTVFWVTYVLVYFSFCFHEHYDAAIMQSFPPTNSTLDGQVNIIAKWIVKPYNIIIITWNKTSLNIPVLGPIVF